jgi:FkbM family methyltransferase
MTPLLNKFFVWTLIFTLLPLRSPSKSVSYNLIEGKPDIYITPISEKIGHTWTNGSVYEKPLIQKFHDLLATHPGDFVALDLGAQTGCFSLLATYFPHSKWYAFEPIAEAADALKINLMLNDIYNVQVYQMAVTNCTGTIILKMPAMNAWGLSTIGDTPLRFAPITECEVSCINLDSFVAAHHIKKVDFIKIDTEGAEFSILQGAKKMIMRDRPLILMEYNETNLQQCGVHKQDIDNFLHEMGYEWKFVSSEDIVCTPRVLP